MSDQTMEEQKIIERGVAFREMVDTEGWRILRAELEQEIRMDQSELVSLVLTEETLGCPKARSLAAHIEVLHNVLFSVDNTLENFRKLSNQLSKE